MRGSGIARRAGAVVGVAAFVYFVFFPQDVATLLAPSRVLVDSATPLLAASAAVSPWLYGLLSVAVLARAATRIWGPRP